ncbi:hypothetical protein DFO70_10313 [Cytobacillus firmus]|uniref:Uncharacterized protein n=3 Tax=Bacillaceae TaxID=186817 RepID=A0A366JZQ1_CYTFI|nr:hypothetical protein DFO70_10313 [Cytobacillus firmus]TDX43826.1 hypothetical protein DFO72_10426 [Cytobacillus oceanisediminis]
MKTRHLFFINLFFILGMVFLTIMDKIFPESTITKNVVLIIGGCFIVYAYVISMKSKILDSKPSAFVWVASVAVILLSNVIILYLTHALN